MHLSRKIKMDIFVIEKEALQSWLVCKVEIENSRQILFDGPMWVEARSLR